MEMQRPRDATRSERFDSEAGRRAPRRACLAALLLLASAASLRGATFTVTTTADSGAGSLRQALLDANGSFGDDVILFAIPGAGVHTIVPASPLPAITQPVTIDGYSQPGSSPNTNPVGEGLNTVLTIEITHNGAGTHPCLQVNAGNSDVLAMIIQGLAIHSCGLAAAISVGTGGDGAFIQGNFLGTDPSGAISPGSESFGLLIVGADGVLVGGSGAFERNLISGNDEAAVWIHSVGGAVGAAVRGNLIGTNREGTATFAYPEGFFPSGVHVTASSNVRIGGSSAGDRNVISGFTGYGVRIEPGGGGHLIRDNVIGADVTGTQPRGNGVGLIVEDDSAQIRGNVIVASAGNAIYRVGNGSVLQGNFIGTDETATLDLGNVNGVFVDTNGVIVGGAAPGEGNVIAHSVLEGLTVADGVSGNPIRGNRIFDNGALGIELIAGGQAGVTLNDPGDGDTGANLLQNFPMITAAVPGASTTHIEGRLNSAASTTFDVDLFSQPHCLRHPQDFVQGETFLGTLPVTTDGSGNAAFAIDVPLVLGGGELVTATATDPAGNTSEFSQRIVLSAEPISGPAAGGTVSNLSGVLFEPGATVTVGGVAASADVQSEFAIAVTMPPLPPGTVHDITVSNPSGLSGTLRNGWVSDFADVPPANQFYAFVQRLAAKGLSAGIGGGLFGVGDSVSRAQMAVFLLKAKHGLCYVPAPCAGAFSDVVCPSLFADWIEALAAEGITGGCGPGVYCPQNPVRRDQMAAFLLKAVFGPSFLPHPCTGVFDDVACPSTFADWIEELAATAITAGCGGNNYCPFSNNARGQMAAFISRTFSLQ